MEVDVSWQTQYKENQLYAHQSNIRVMLLFSLSTHHNRSVKHLGFMVVKPLVTFNSTRTFLLCHCFFALPRVSIRGRCGGLSRSWSTPDFRFPTMVAHSAQYAWGGANGVTVTNHCHNYAIRVPSPLLKKKPTSACCCAEGNFRENTKADISRSLGWTLL